MNMSLRITVKAARVNAGLNQDEVANQLSKYFGKKVSRQRVAYFENNPDQIPQAFGVAFSRIYHWPLDAFNFASKST